MKNFEKKVLKPYRSFQKWPPRFWNALLIQMSLKKKLKAVYTE